MSQAKPFYPARHADQHLPYGSDPIDFPCCVDATGGTTYPELVQAHPCLTHYWPADEPSGNLIDRVGGLDLSGVAATSDTDGLVYPQFGAAGPFPALPELTAVVNAGVGGTAPNDESRFVYSPVGIAAQRTIEMWLYVTMFDPVRGNTILQAAGTTLEITDPGSGSKLQAGIGATTITDTVALPLNAWQHIALTYDGTTATLYRNGIVVASHTASSSSGSGTLSWLNNYTGPTYTPVNGRAAQLAVYDCALTADEVAGHVAAQDEGGNTPDGWVLTSDGDGGFDFEPATVKVDGTNYEEILTGTNLTSTDNSDGTVTLDATGGGTFDPATATTWWFPLVDSDGLAVLDSNDALIPTLIPI